MSTFPQQVRKDDRPEAMHAGKSLTRRVMGLLVICLLAIGAYALSTKSDEAQPRVAGQGPNPAARIMPVVAVAAKRGDIGVYLSG
ncbi:MAG TPA: hypothetical protein VJ692_07985, partial [Nitrospiraceae bacterium]|nr:hypothetical protein [Nitrospiraceae bacterium]